MKKKIGALMLTICMAAAMAAGCGSSASDSSANGNNNASQNSTGQQSSSAETSSAAENKGTGTAESSVKDSDNSDSSATGETGAAGETDSSSEEETTSAGSKRLVVYFSATGNTEEIAKEIADSVDGTLFEVEPEEPYTEEDLDYNDSDSRVSKEHEDSSLQNVKLKTTKVPDWDSYDIVFVGYPIWWGEAAWPMTSFVKANDFSGKTVIPFCTSSMSDIGDSGTNLASAAGTGDWTEGQRFAAGTSAGDIADWISSLHLSVRE